MYPQEPRSQHAPFSTFAQVIAANLEHADGGGYTFLQEDGREHFVRWDELSREALHRGRKLLAAGLRKGDRLALLLPEGLEFILTFLGAVSVGVIPVPMYPPVSFSRFDAYLEDAANILRAAGARAVCLSQGLQELLAPLLGASEGPRPLIAEDFFAGPVTGEPPPDEDLRPEDVMFLQFTSGSTAAPKGVRVTHASVLANCMGIINALGLRRGRDNGVSWLPMYHDMGLVGFVLAPLIVRCEVFFIPTLRFAMSPGLWMQMVSRHRATVTFGPNFGLAIAVKHASREELAQLDLSSLRVIGCGAEPNHPTTLRAFVAHFAQAGLPPGALVTCYGMAEATLAMSFSAMGTSLATDVIQKEPYHNRELARPASGEEPAEQLLEFVSCGRPLPGHHIQILDEAGQPLPERHIGEVVFTGPSVTAGYQGDAEATRRAFTAQGLRTGDCGYLAEGALYVTSRKKDLLVINGRNYDPQTVEWAAAEVPGLRKGNIVAFTRPGLVTEELVIVAELRDGALPSVKNQVRGHIQARLSLPVADVLLLEPGELTKTSSGKLQRSKTRQQYLSGALRADGAPPHG